MKKFFFKIAAFVGLALLPAANVYAEVYMSIDQAKERLWQGASMTPVEVVLTKEQMDTIEKASDVNVHRDHLKAWRTDAGGWFIVDQVIGKHENIDIAFAFTEDGKVHGIEVLQYRETYGSEIRHPKYIAQFLGKDHTEHLKLDHQIKNLSGGTLSARHLTDGVNRLSQTWYHVLRNM